MVEAGEDLTELPDVGKSVAQHIVELFETGTITRMEEVTAEIPETLVELMRLDGVGPKKAKKLFDQLDVRTVDDLEEQIERGAVQELYGFGVKSVQKISRAIEDHRKHTGRFQIHEVERLIAGLVEYVDRYYNGDLRDEHAERLMNTYFEVNQAVLRKRQEYVKKFSKVMSSIKVMRFFQLENKVQAEVNAALAVTIPLADPR